MASLLPVRFEVHTGFGAVHLPAVRVVILINAFAIIAHSSVHRSIVTKEFAAF
jgi:hypothetical protein